MTILLFVFMTVLLVGVPVFIALAGSSLLYTHFIGNIPDFVILHRMVGGIDSFPLLAVPFFILAGNLMNSAGITNRIYDFAVAYHKGSIHRDHLLKSMIPLYLGRVAFFVKENIDSSASEVEEKIESLCKVFEEMKPYLIERWAKEKGGG